jgi:hypothetical protein
VREWKFEKSMENWSLEREWKIPEGTWISALHAGEIPVLALRKKISTEFYTWEKNPEKILETPGYFFYFGKPLPTGELSAISDRSGREEVWALHIQKKSARKIIAVLGGVNSFATANDRWWVSSYEHGGYDIAQAEPVSFSPETIEAFHETEETIAPPPISEQKEYSAWSSLRPRAWIPSLLIVPNGMQISAWIPGFDVSQKHLYNIFGGYDTRGSPYLFIDYSYRFWKATQFNIETNYSPSYLIRTRTFLLQWGASIGVSTSLGPNLPTFSANVVYRKLESSPYASANQSIGLGGSVSQTFYSRTNARAIAPHFATVVSLSHYQYLQALGSKDNYYATSLGLDQYLPNPLLNRHVLKLSFKGGITEGTSLFNSFFQGGGELAFSAGRGFFLNRGFLPGSFSAQKLACINLDYLFPIVEIERGWSQWPFFLKRIDGALIADATSGGKFRTVYYSAGAELKSYWKTFFYFPTTIRLGGYHGFGPAGEAFYGTMAIEASL